MIRDKKDVDIRGPFPSLDSQTDGVISVGTARIIENFDDDVGVGLVSVQVLLAEVRTIRTDKVGRIQINVLKTRLDVGEGDKVVSDVGLERRQKRQEGY